MKKLILFFVVAALLSGTALATKVETIQWTSNGSGSATVYGNIDGILGRVIIVPSATAAPTDLYDIVIYDESGWDILYGIGVDCSASAKEEINKGTSGFDVPHVSGLITVQVTNAGDTKSGTIYLFYR